MTTVLNCGTGLRGRNFIFANLLSNKKYGLGTVLMKNLLKTVLFLGNTYLDVAGFYINTLILEWESNSSRLHNTLSSRN